MQKIAVMFGGKSAEHSVSVRSAKSIVNALDPKKYVPVLIGIDKKGNWKLFSDTELLAIKDNDSLPNLQTSNLVDTSFLNQVDCVFSVLHGTYGEDGAMQGFLDTLGIAYVGAGIAGSAICMDKGIAKRLLREANIPVTDFLEVDSAELDANEVFAKLGNVLYVKPVNGGSSIGVTRVTIPEDLAPALKLALEYDNRALIEKAVSGREVECAVWGNRELQCSDIGEIQTDGGFYTFDNKYISQTATKIIIPVELAREIREQAQSIAKQAYKCLACEGYARVDLFISTDNQILINEINTLPGFTSISMFPMLAMSTGLTYQQLLTDLIVLAQTKFHEKSLLKI